MEYVRSLFQTFTALCTDEIINRIKIAGARSTKLISVVVNSLRRNLEREPLGEAMAYFYCVQNENDHRDIIRSLVRQLSTLRNGGFVPTCIDDCFAKKEKDGFPSSSLTFQECASLIRKLMKDYTKVTIVLDALDECDESTRDLLIDELNKLVSEPSSCILKVLISSGTDNNIKYRTEGGQDLTIMAADNQENVKDTIRISPGDQTEKVTSSENETKALGEDVDEMYAFPPSTCDRFIF